MIRQIQRTFFLIPLVFIGCGDSPTTSTEEETAPPVLAAEPSDEPVIITARDLRKRLRANERAKFERVGNDIVEAHLFQSGVKDISALKGLPLRFLDLGMCEITDVSAIEGMPLSTLILENTKVDDISVVKGMPLEVLQLQETGVTDLSMLEGMPIRELNLKNVKISDLSMVATLPLKTLWVPGTDVTDISPLTGKSMVSLDIEGTQVATLEPLAKMSTLRRLNIVDTPISDLTPLKGLQLERITLTPANIKTGIEVLRDMPTLSQILTTMEGNPRQAAAEFWQKYDAGVFALATEEAEETPDASAGETATPQEGNSATETTTREAEPTPEPAADKETDSTATDKKG